ncbi:hypothetical protein FJT64_001165 [Amphibalanus amphitrite]|uniref:Uncharacterized protein n=1 Tax=Amphibalanus amphitrite TaxID=1232801 RepID=A0A6A4V9I3_AMPAM|nr:hypothetical protein FJT64_001165 [Amphibalanus amphitrite]
MMKVASKTKNYTEVDDFIVNRLCHYMYNNGEGRLVPIDYVVINRNRDRPKTKLLEVNRRAMDESGEFPPLQLPDEDPTLDTRNYVGAEGHGYRVSLLDIVPPASSPDSRRRTGDLGPLEQEPPLIGGRERKIGQETV